MKEERKEEKQGTGALAFTQRLVVHGVRTMYFDRFDEAKLHGTVNMPQGVFVTIADPESPNKPFGLGHVTVVKNRSLARWLIKRCGPKGALGELRGEAAFTHKGLMVSIRDAVASGFVRDEAECRAIMRGEVKVEHPPAPIPQFEMMDNDQLQGWAYDNGVDDYDTRRSRDLRVKQLYAYARRAFEKQE